jgi:tRNA G37 N-methylase TrmD
MDATDNRSVLLSLAQAIRTKRTTAVKDKVSSPKYSRPAELRNARPDSVVGNRQHKDITRWNCRPFGDRRTCANKVDCILTADG